MPGKAKPKPRGKKRDPNPGIDMPPRAFGELCELMRHGANFEAACHWVGFYKAEVFDYVKRHVKLAARLTKAVEDGELADKCALYLTLVEHGHKRSVAMELAGVGATIIHGRKQVDPMFAVAHLEAEQKGTDYLEDIATKRAIRGSDVLLMFILKARDRQRFADSPPQVQMPDATLKVTMEERHELGRRIAFALRLAATGQAAGNGSGNGADTSGPVVEGQRGAAD